MSWADKITNTLFGRRIGLQQLTTNQSGSGRSGTVDLIAGPEAVRHYVATETTSTNCPAYGASVLTTVSSSCVFTLDPPIPGVMKFLQFDTTGTSPIYLKTANNETIDSTLGTSMTTLCSSQGGNVSVLLHGVSTASWAMVNSLSTASLRASTST